MKNTYKHLLKVVSKQASRPVLTGAFFDTDGSITVTDSHRLLKLYNRHEFSNSQVMKLDTMESLEGTYPETHRLIPSPDKPITFTMDHVYSLLPFLKSAKKKTDCLKITFTETGTVFELIDTGIKVALDIKVEHMINTDLYCNAIYLKDAIDFLKDSGMRDCEWILVSALRPFNFHSGNAFDYIVTPIRKN